MITREIQKHTSRPATLPSSSAEFAILYVTRRVDWLMAPAGSKTSIISITHFASVAVCLEHVIIILYSKWRYYMRMNILKFAQPYYACALLLCCKPTMYVVVAASNHADWMFRASLCLSCHTVLPIDSGHSVA